MTNSSGGGSDMSNNDIGIHEGDACNREDCKGMIESHPVENCSCHINPPCGACTTPRNYCSDCRWDEKDDVVDDYQRINIDANTGFSFPVFYRRKLDRTKIDYVIKSHTTSSQICEGVYPNGVTINDVRDRVKGTFGGRFEYFENGNFKYIAYTD